MEGFESCCLLCSSCSGGLGLDMFGEFEEPSRRGSSIPCAVVGLLSPQLWSLFVLTRVLNLPKEEVQDLLGRMGGSNPGEWFTICRPCSGLVRKLFELHQKLLELQVKIGGLQKKARKDIIAQCSNREEQGYGRGGGQRRMTNARELIWNLVKKGNAAEKGKDEEEEGWTVDDVRVREDSESNAVKLEIEDYSFSDDHHDGIEGSLPTFAGESEEEECDYSSGSERHRMDLGLGEKLDSSSNKKGSNRKCRKRRGPLKMMTQELEQEDIILQGDDTPGDGRRPHRRRMRRRKQYEIMSKPKRDSESDQDEPDEGNSNNDPLYVPTPMLEDDFDAVSEAGSDPLDVDEFDVKPKKCKGGRKSNRRQLQVILDDSLLEEFGVNKRIKIVRNAELQRKESDRRNGSISVSTFAGPGDECKVCGEWFILEDMESHLQFHVECKNTTCLVCNHPTTSERLLQGHMKQMHEGQYKNFVWECDKCEFITILRYRKFVHETQHRFEDSLVRLEDGDGEKYRCELCGVVFPNYDNASIHREAEHASKFRRIPKLDFYLRSKRRPPRVKLKSQVTEGSHSEKNLKLDAPSPSVSEANAEEEWEGGSRYPGPGGKCVICGDWFGIQYMEAHLQDHEKYKDHTCDRCHFPFKSHQMLKAHQAFKDLHSRTSGKYLYECPSCEFVTRIPYRRDRHIYQHKVEDNLLSNQNLWKCRLCQDTFNSRYAAHTHLRAQHGKELGLREYKCSDCGKLVTSGALLKSHIQVHHTQTPNRRKFVCEACGRSFLQRTSLKIHEKKFHSGPAGTGNKEPVLCDICGKAFAYRKGMLRHKKSHYLRGGPGEPRKVAKYRRKCAISRCDYMAPNHVGMVKHIKSAHAHLYPEQCGVCEARFANPTKLLRHQSRVHRNDNCS